MREADPKAAEAEKAHEGVEPGSAPRPASNLKQLIVERGPLSQPQLARVFGEVLDDLEMAHSQAMLHRDITSARIIREGGHWKLTDYGIGGIGSVQYMSPERCQGRLLDARSDTYSIGVCLYEAATGRVPFDTTLKFECIKAQISTPPPAPRSIRPEISVELERMILRSLAKNPDGRFQTAREFRQSFHHLARRAGVQRSGRTGEDAAAVLPVPASEPDTGRPPLENVPSRRVKPGLILAVVVAAVVAAAAFGLLPKLVGGRLPNLVGLSRAEAQDRLRALGLGVEFVDSDDTMTAGRVVKQEPAAGSKVVSGGSIKLAVSTGRIAVPEVEGLTSEEAGVRLAAAGLDIGRSEQVYSDNHPVGTVVNSNPKPGASVNAGSAVALQMAAGRLTCPACGLRREMGTRFCTRCGHKF